MQLYLESVLGREEHAKEVRLFGLGARLLDRYRSIFTTLYREDRALTIRRDVWGFFLGLIGTCALYLAYAWIALATVRGIITLGKMSMYLGLFRQGQSAVSAALSSIGGMYEDNLYLSTLYEYLDTPVRRRVANWSKARTPRTGSASRMSALSIPTRRNRRSPMSRCTCHRAAASRWSVRTGRARPRSSSC